MSESATADIHLIQRILPHRYPFLLIDRVVDMDGYASGTGIKAVSANEPYFQGHFPGNPVMPGVLMLEAMAQTAGVIVGCAGDYADKGAKIYFMTLDKVRFRRIVGPGDLLKLHVVTLRGKPGGKVWKFHCDAKVGDDLAAEADLSAMMELPDGA